MRMERQQELEIRCGYTVTEEKKKLWMILLDLSEEFKRVCQKYQLRFFLHAGSLLGAVRHGGFIPWDDDMDFIMPREDFERLLLVAEKEFHQPYFLHTLGNSKETFNYGRAVLRNGETTGVQLLKDLYSRDHNGIGIDIMALDAAVRQPFLRKVWWKKVDRCAAMLYLKGAGHNANKIPFLGWGKEKTGFYRWVAGYFTREYLAEHLERISRKYQNRETGIGVVNHEISGEYRHLILKSDWYETSVEMPFEQNEYPVPTGYDEILKKYYGADYMSFPVEEKRKGHHYRILKTDEGYRDYLRHYQDIFKHTEGKRIVVFGAGKMTEHYLLNTEERYRPEWLVDNDKNKWGKSVMGINVKNPESLHMLKESEQYVVVCSVYYKEIEEQLENMGINNYYIYVQNIKWL